MFDGLFIFTGVASVLTYFASGLYVWNAINSADYGRAAFYTFLCLLMLVCFTNAIWRRK